MRGLYEELLSNTQKLLSNLFYISGDISAERWRGIRGNCRSESGREAQGCGKIGRGAGEGGQVTEGLQFEERLESVKAGIVGLLTAGMAWGSAAIAHAVLPIPAFTAPAFTGLGVALGVSGAIALCSGFLFGITYRYIIRQDRNPHLKAGAVGAFGLVRGLAQVEGNLRHQSDLLPGAIALGESLLLFLMLRWVLDWGLHQGWLKPFN